MIPFKHTRNGALTIKGDVIILNANTATKSDYPLILKIWEASVRKTHHFLKESDLLFYKEIIPQALDSVNLIVWKIKIIKWLVLVVSIKTSLSCYF